MLSQMAKMLALALAFVYFVMVAQFQSCLLYTSGLALGVGMLVDNSVVVIENIYRLRGRGVPAARASVQGARQVAGSIVSLSLIHICRSAPVNRPVRPRPRCC